MGHHFQNPLARTGPNGAKSAFGPAVYRWALILLISLHEVTIEIVDFRIISKRHFVLETTA